MKNLLLIFFFIFCFRVDSEEWNREGSGFSSSEEFILSDKSKVIHYKNKYTWKDTIGNYGYSKCFGLIVTDISDEIIDYSMYCNSHDQDKDQYTQKYNRNTELDIGVGTSVIIGGTGKWKNYIGSSCSYAINYLNLSLFIVEKCKN